MVYSMRYSSPLGPLFLAARDDTLVGAWFEGQKYFAATLNEPPQESPSLPVFSAASAWLDRYFAGQKPAVSELKLAPQGGEFRQQVWDILCQIPYGQTTTYGEIAARIAALRGRATMSAQAVGGAVGHNPISVIIPCHRVVGTNGSLTGYAGGLDLKVKLLTLEGVNIKM